MDKEFVPYEQALWLKVLGFDEPCFGYYAGDGSDKLVNIPSHKGLCFNQDSLANLKPAHLAPLYQQAFRFFRTKFRMPSWIEEYNGASTSFHFVINSQGKYKYHTLDQGIKFDTQEAAELACLKELILLMSRGIEIPKI